MCKSTDFFKICQKSTWLSSAGVPLSSAASSGTFFPVELSTPEYPGPGARITYDYAREGLKFYNFTYDYAREG